MNRVQIRTALKQHLAFSQLDIAAIAFATLLSCACLARGAVYDATVAALLLLSLPILWVAQRGTRSVHMKLQRVGSNTLIALLVVFLLQYLIPDSSLWEQVGLLTKQEINATIIQDKAAWMAGIGRLCFIIISFMIALSIGSSESSARIFLQSLLITGTLCLTLTFFMATRQGVPVSTHYSYSHGFVNPNNASAYLGVMVLLALSQAVRFFKFSTVVHKSVLDLIDQLKLNIIIKGIFILFALLMALAGLFMTGSRGGILLTLLACMLFYFIIIMKMQLSKRWRRKIILGTALIIGGILIWSFMNFGQVLTHKVNKDGIDSNTRLDIYEAVLPMINDHALLGTGLGSFPDVFQQYRPKNIPSDGIIDKAHNSYLEFAAEMGLPALTALMLALGWMGYTLYHGVIGRRERYVTPAFGLAMWFFAAAYSMVDFPLQIPALTALFLAITTVCVSQTDRRFSEPAQNSSSAPTRRVRIRRRRNAMKLA